MLEHQDEAATDPLERPGEKHMDEMEDEQACVAMEMFGKVGEIVEQSLMVMLVTIESENVARIMKEVEVQDEKLDESTSGERKVR